MTYLRAVEPVTRWALLADTHVSADLAADYHGSKPAEGVGATVEQVATSGVTATLVNGDIAWHQGLAEDYDAARQLLDPLVDLGPLITLPGNHDHRDRLCTAFSQPRMDEGAERVVTVADAGQVRLVCLDSLRRPDIVPGRLGTDQIVWLDGWLSSYTDKPAVVFVHHPLDDHRNGLLDSADLLAILKPQPHVKAVFTAHDHVFSHREEEGIIVVTQPAVGFPFAGKKMHGWLEASFSPEGAEIATRPLGGRASEKIELRWSR